MELIDFTGIFDLEGRFSSFTGYGDLCAAIVSFSEKSRREGLLALEDDIGSLESGLMKLLLQLVVDGTDPEMVRSIGEKRIRSILHYHNEILSCAEFALLNRNLPDYETIFGHYFKSRDTGPYSNLVLEIKQQLDAMTSVPETPAVPERYGDITGVVLSGFDESYKIMLVENHFDSVLHINSMYNEMILTGMLSVQSGDNPRIVQEKLLAFTALSGKNE